MTEGDHDEAAFVLDDGVGRACFCPGGDGAATSMDKPAMKDDKMAKDKKSDGMAKPATTGMQKPDAMMDKKDNMSSDKMKK
jgi:hypothetical protein